MSNINNFYFNNLDLKLSNSEYWDFYLASDETCLTMYDNIISGSCLVAQYDFNEASIFGSTFVLKQIISKLLKKRGRRK